MADDDSWLYGEDNDVVEEQEAGTEEVEAVKGEIESLFEQNIIYCASIQLQPCLNRMMMVLTMEKRRVLRVLMMTRTMMVSKSLSTKTKSRPQNPPTKTCRFSNCRGCNIQS